MYLLYFHYIILTLVLTSLRALSAHPGEPIFSQNPYFFPFFHYEVIVKLTVHIIDCISFWEPAQQFPVHGIIKDMLCKQHDQYLVQLIAQMGTLLAKGRYPMIVHKLTTFILKFLMSTISSAGSCAVSWPSVSGGNSSK